MPKKFYQLTRLQRIATLLAHKLLSVTDAHFFANNTGLTQERANQLVENQLTTFALPEGLARNLLVNGKLHQVPMVTEEPSVIAAASNGARLAATGGGFRTSQPQRLLLGQIILTDIVDVAATTAMITAHEAELLQVANAAHPSLQQRGGGARWLRVRQLSERELSLDLAVDVQQAMGANMLNTMLEAVATTLQAKWTMPILMSILSNYATESTVTATVDIPITVLATPQFTGISVAKKIAAASHIAQIDPYRAVTHNKGIMNGVDAAVLAFGNDCRVIESGAHAYAARDGQYRGLSQWQVVADQLHGELTLPLPLGFVGGATRLLPAVQPNQRLATVESAQELMQVICALGLAQNLAALKALVTTGIQQGHMRLQAKSLAVTAGAQTAEVAPLIVALQQAPTLDLATAQKLLTKLRQQR
ncbi:hydroxymethylglutaryl-CoA reductase, degradative [Loigolactobacillus jiayinensis]|uniref:3-hydroxy-3-methylglutaryl coenzyme A reductase n=1 Tax=Loigolactobacillus jiayinensis TaxID=2486016 RepID=A0ABW1RIC4_9LACO|nr:hydroxymethylglutaryl-CoA reductase, degradative [Loigolactobacillus jiayinensis]